ncbi:MAG: hypothetical protein KKH98_04525 [Spirochaetes bacterium]|nr:hypothetical protein [Spirochaetota bacterium]
MDKVFKIECPDCHTILIIDRATGEIKETRAPILEETTGDRFEDALKKFKKDRSETEEKFARLQEEEKEKKKKMNELFQQEMKKVKKEGKVDKELRDIDL